MTEQNRLEKFQNLFGKAGNYGSINDCQNENPIIANTNPPPNNEQLQREVGLDGIVLLQRRGRIRLNQLGHPVREQGCSSVYGFIDNTRQIDELH